MTKPPARHRWFLYGLVALLFAGGVWYFGFRAQAPTQTSGRGFRSSSSMPAPVRAVAVQRENLPVHLRAIGTVSPLNTVVVRSRVEGELLRLAISEGQYVEKGQLLAEIDPVSYRIRLAQMEAQLRQNEAQLQTVRSDLERFKQLHQQALVTQQQLEAQQALVAEREAAVAADLAQVEDARRQLAYTKIEAPISGRLGLRRVDVGNLVRSSDSDGLMVITQTQPIAIVFTVPEMDVQNVIKPLRAGEKLLVEAWDRSEENQIATGHLQTVDNQIDLATGTLRLKAVFPNKEERLFPNQFVNIRLRVRTIQDAIVVPGAVVQFGSRGTYVYVVDDQSKATVRDVVLGPADGTKQSIAKGLNVGELVVLEGLDRLREGRIVTVLGDEPAKSERPAKAGPTASGGARGGGGKKKGT